MRFDAHQHFWSYSSEHYGWIEEGMSQLKRDFLPADLRTELDAVKIDGCVAVQARQDLEETRWLLSLADQYEWIAGVVGWCDLRAEDAESQLSQLSSHPRFVGVRHVVQDEPDDQFLLRDDFGRGISKLVDHGLTYDILVYPRQLPAAVAFARRYSDLPMILDHLAKPDLKVGDNEAWGKQIRELASCENVSVKLSGLVTEADWSSWTPAELSPYLDTVFEAFGAKRVAYGSDWPVCLLAAEYSQWYETINNWSSKLSDDERDDLFGGNAARFYGLRNQTT